jgi:N-acetylglucosaminylphosphatidylinositol deacetylase
MLFILLPFLSVLIAALLTQPLKANTDSAFAHDTARILLVTAHPDDECLFFAPTILALNSSNLYSLCLSTGDADGLGEIRVGELGHSLDVLGIDKTRRWVVDSPCVSSFH